MIRLKVIMAVTGAVLLLFPLLRIDQTWGLRPWDEPVLCPRCKSDQVIYILYGEPNLDADLKSALAGGKVELGGCLVTRDSKRWECRACGHKWGSVGLESGNVPLGEPRQDFGAAVAEYAGLSAGLRKTFRVVEKEKATADYTSLRYTKVLPKKKIAGQMVVPVKVTYEYPNDKSQSGMSIIEYWQLTADKLEMAGYQIPQEKGISKNDKVILKAPFYPGADWRTGEYDKIVAATNETIQLPAGNFINCLKIKTFRKINGELVYEETAWYAPGVGEVKAIAAYPLEFKRIVNELVSVQQAPR